MWDVARLQWYDSYWWESHGRPEDRVDHSFSESFPLLEANVVQAYAEDMTRLLAAVQQAFPQVSAAAGPAWCSSHAAAHDPMICWHLLAPACVASRV
jgi:hypothetical protein